ncbi:MAG: DUF3455 domain-containing protein [Bacteroidia bacterium]
MRKSKINLTAVIVLFSGVIVITACQKNNDLVPSQSGTEFTTGGNERLSPPAVPAILEVPSGNSVCYHVFATGVQIYVVTLTSTGYAWVFQAPDAKLYANAGLNGQVGTHYGGPTWESISGSKVVGIKLQGVTVDVTAVPWLLLGAGSSQGPGVFNGVTYIQRVNTTGGLAPITGADAAHVGEQAMIPYTAEYFFYRAD